MNRKVQVSLYMTPKQAEALKRLSEKTDVPQSVYLRRAIDLVLKRENGHGG